MVTTYVFCVLIGIAIGVLATLALKGEQPSEVERVTAKVPRAQSSEPPIPEECATPYRSGAPPDGWSPEPLCAPDKSPLPDKPSLVVEYALRKPKKGGGVAYGGCGSKWIMREKPRVLVTPPPVDGSLKGDEPSKAAAPKGS